MRPDQPAPVESVIGSETQVTNELRSDWTKPPSTASRRIKRPDGELKLNMVTCHRGTRAND